jgi:hypothetical protein
MAIVNSYSAEVIEAVREDRNTYYSGHPGHTVIPNYSNCIDGAMELLKYMYSDEGIKIAADVTGTPNAPQFGGDVNLDDSNWSDFMRECNKLRQGANVIVHDLVEPIFYLTGVDHLKINCPVRSMTYRTDGGILNTDQYWAKETAAWEAKWPQMIIDAGLQ